MNSRIDDLSINTLRMLGVDEINKAKSGHPGIVLGAAPIVHTLFTRHMNIVPEDPQWFNRDRFILSAGHGSALLYALLHVSGFDLKMDELKNFRQLGSKTPGHPEYGHTVGVEATTGPLGQGIAMGVGMAIAEKHLSARFNHHQIPVIDHYTYILCGDGCLQEGVAMEACSLAGRLKLNKYIILYDSNDIQLDGEVKMANTENIKVKFEGMGFDYFRVEDGNSVEDIDEAICQAKLTDKPSIIEIKTTIGYGAPNAGDCSVHGSPLGADSTEELKNFLGWEYPEFTVPEEVYKFYNEKVVGRGSVANTKWNKVYSDYADEFPEEWDLLDQIINGEFDINKDAMPKYEVGSGDATRNVCGKCISEISSQIPSYIGGCADLVKTTQARGANGNFDPENPTGRNICYGVREHAMGAIVNGLTLHGLRGFGGGFLIFADYLKPAIRLSALMNIPSLFVFSHNSAMVGEDGPTHQPIEQMTMLRSIPNCNVMNPADPNETVYAFEIAHELKHTPTIVSTTRQKVPTLANTSYDGVLKGGYVIKKESNKLTGVIISAGSEVSLAIDVANKLEENGEGVRVVSMPSMFLFDKQSEEYKASVIPANVKSMAIEMACTMPWYKYSRNVYGVDRFGLSAPGAKVQEELGFTVDKVLEFYNKIN